MKVKNSISLSPLPLCASATLREKNILSLSNADFLYLQENYVVTDGIFKDENIIFDNITSEWKEFCHKTLAFEIPVYEPVFVQSSKRETSV